MKTSRSSIVSPTTLVARQPLSAEDLFFPADRVLDRELVPCLLYELLRESVTARNLERDFVENLKTATANELDKLFARQVEIRFSINHKLDIPQFVSHIFEPRYRRAKTLATLPWQKLHPKIKNYLSEPCTRINEAAFISNNYFHTEKLAKVSREHPEIYDLNATSVPPSRAMLDADTWAEGCMAFCVVADFARYDDNAIRAVIATDLADEIINSRPRGLKPQVRKESGQGRIAEWRGILNSLGLARLSARFTAQELRTKMPKIYKQIAKPLADKGTTAVQKKLNGARHRFVVRFHEILPFEKHQPLCLQPSRSSK